MAFTVWSVEVCSTELTLDRMGLFDDDFGFLHTREKWFCKPQLLQVLPLAIHLTLWFADQVKPQFLQSWFGGRVKLDVVGRWLGGREGRWEITALTCGAGCEFVICSWVLWPNSIYMAKRNAWAGSRVSRSNFLWISGSNIFAINKSLIRVSSWLPSSQFSKSSFNFPKKCSIDSPLVCFVVRSTYLSNVILRWRIISDSMIVQSSAVVRMSILRLGFCYKQFDVLRCPNWDIALTQSFDQPVPTVYLHTLLLSPVVSDTDSPNSFLIERSSPIFPSPIVPMILLSYPYK